MARKVVEIKTVVRTFPSAGSATGGAMNVEEFDATINTKYLQNGWDILTMAPLPTVGPDGISVLIVLARYGDDALTPSQQPVLVEVKEPVLENA